MKECPHCKKEVESLRGNCPHCKGDLTAEGFREMLTDINGGVQTVTTDVGALREQSEAQIKRIEYLEKAAKDAAANGSNTDPNERPKPVNIMNVVRGLMMKDMSRYPYEKKVLEENQERMESLRQGRALDTGAVGTGGAIIPPEYLPQQMIDMLRSKVVAEALGATVLTDLTGSPVTIPALLSGATAYDVEENTAKTPSDQCFGVLTLTPHEVAAATIYSKRMALLSNPSVDRVVQDDLMKVVARRIDLMAMTGAGGIQPVGIINTPAIGTYTLAADVGNGGIPAVGDIDGIEETLDLADAFEGAVGWAWNPRTKYTWKGMRTDSGAGVGTGPYMFRDDLKAGNLDGYKYGETTQIPRNVVKGASGAVCSYIIFGNWNDLVIAYWGGLEVAASDQAEGTFLKNQVIIKVSMLYDIGIRHLGSFVVVDGVLR